MNVSVIIFPGSNCDQDIVSSIYSITNKKPKEIWYKDNIPKNTDFIILPGGFSFGDYLRSGAIASASNIIREVINFSKKGTPIMGICNGFQILIESGLLQGALMRNSSLSFICRDIIIKPTNTKTIFTNKSTISKMPIAHNEGNYFANSNQIKEIEDNDQIAFQYCDENGDINAHSNPNGSINNIAGVFNKSKNVLGMMPHPERAAESIHGCDDGRNIFESLLS